jgi:ubiquitin-conjugating enzyme E2 D/E
MLNLEKIEAMKRIKEEFTEINNNPIANIGSTVGLPDEDNIFEWQCSLMGPKDTSYNGGVFFLSIKFPDNYPKKPPEVVFRTPIYHINVNPNKSNLQGAEPLGHVCISTLNWWKDESRIKQVLSDIFALFYMANPDSPYGLDRADEFRFNRALHEEKIRYFTKKYANPAIANRDYDQSWDFSFLV